MGDPGWDQLQGIGQSFFRQKTGTPVIVHLGTEALNLFKDLPAEEPLFPYLATARAGDRATEFSSWCRQLLGQLRSSPTGQYVEVDDLSTTTG